MEVIEHTDRQRFDRNSEEVWHLQRPLILDASHQKLQAISANLQQNSFTVLFEKRSSFSTLSVLAFLC